MQLLILQTEVDGQWNSSYRLVQVFNLYSPTLNQAPMASGIAVLKRYEAFVSYT